MTGKDRWFWAVLVGFTVLLLLVGMWMSWRSSSTYMLEEYLSDESRPEVVVHNAYVAAYRGDLDRFLSYFEPSVWPSREHIEGVRVEFWPKGQINIGQATIEGDKAKVPVEMVQARSWGPFGVDFWISRETVVLRRKGGRWYITMTLPYVYIRMSPLKMMPMPPH